jgi:hypothetical protein
MNINIGDFVCCDFCNSNGEDSQGGVIIGSGTAVCGDCCEKNGYYKSDFQFKDEITEFFSKDKTFRENVLDFRLRTTGTIEGEIIIQKM